MQKTDFLHHEQDGIAFYTDLATGASGMSHSGLAKFVGVARQAIDGLLENLAKSTPEQVKSDTLRPFAGKNCYLSTGGLHNASVIKDDVCAAIVEYYAFESRKRTDVALYAFKRFARMGIRSLIHGVTGWKPTSRNHYYDPVLSAYIAEQFLPWAARFPEEFFRELYRLRGWDYSLRAENKPYVVGKFINDLIYARMPDGVFQEMQDRNPVTDKGYRAVRFHQMLTSDQGNMHLERVMMTVLALMKGADSWEQFYTMLERVCPKTINDSKSILNSKQHLLAPAD